MATIASMVKLNRDSIKLRPNRKIPYVKCINCKLHIPKGERTITCVLDDSTRLATLAHRCPMFEYNKETNNAKKD